MRDKEAKTYRSKEELWELRVDSWREPVFTIRRFFWIQEVNIEIIWPAAQMHQISNLGRQQYLVKLQGQAVWLIILSTMQGLLARFCGDPL
jgi:hypothetical protein